MGTMTYDLENSAYVNSLYAGIGDDMFQSQVKNSKIAQEDMNECREDKTCSGVLARREKPAKTDLNHKHYEVQLTIQAKTEMKIFLKYRQIVNKQDKKCTYEVFQGQGIESGSSILKPSQDAFILYMNEANEIEDLEFGCYQGGTSADGINRHGRRLKDLTLHDFKADLSFNLDGGFQEARYAVADVKFPDGDVVDEFCPQSKRRRRGGSSIPKEALRLTYNLASPKKKIVNERTMTFEYQPDARGTMLVMQKHFIHFINLEAVAQARKRIVFVLDRSGSMAAPAGNSTLWDQLVLSTKTLISNGLNEDDKFNLVLFNHEIEVFSENYMYSKSDDDFLKETETFLKPPTGEARGLTYYTPALNKGVQLLKDEIERNRNDVDDTVVNMIVFITDGKNIEGKNIQHVIDEVRRAIGDDDIYINTVGIGESAPLLNLQVLAHAFQGHFRDVTNLNSDKEAMVYELEDFFKKSLIPHKMNKVQYDYIVEGSLIINKPMLPEGEELIVMGKVDEDCYEPEIIQGAGPESGDDAIIPTENIHYPCENDMVSLPLGEMRETFTQDKFPLIRDNNYDQLPISINSETSVEVMYNVMQIDQKEKKIDAFLTNTTEYSQLQNDIITMGEAYHLVTRFTSLILTSKDDKIALDSEGSQSLDYPPKGAADSVQSGDSGYYHEECNANGQQFDCFYELDLATPNEYCNEIKKQKNDRVPGKYGCNDGCSRNHVLTDKLPLEATDAYQNLERMPGFPKNEGECLYGQRQMWCRTKNGTLEKKDMQFAIGKDARGRYRYSRGNNKSVDKFCSKYWRNGTLAYKEHRILVWRFNDQDIK